MFFSKIYSVKKKNRFQSAFDVPGTMFWENRKKTVSKLMKLVINFRKLHKNIHTDPSYENKYFN